MIIGAAMVPFAWLLRRSLPETLEAAPAAEQSAAPLLKVALLGILTMAAM